MPPTPQSHPQLGWRVLAGQVPTARGPFVFNFPHIVFAIAQGQGGVYIHAIDTRTGQRMDRPCSQPGRALARVIDWARQHTLQKLAQEYRKQDLGVLCL
jgi:hypothetical protein